VLAIAAVAAGLGCDLTTLYPERTERCLEELSGERSHRAGVDSGPPQAALSPNGKGHGAASARSA